MISGRRAPCHSKAKSSDPTYRYSFPKRMSFPRAAAAASRALRSSQRTTASRAFSLGTVVRSFFTSTPEMGQFTDKKWWDDNTVALVTGGNKGIGFAIAQHFAEQGVAVVIGARNPSLGQAAVKELQKAVPDASARFCQLDITDAASVSSCAAEIEKDFGKLDILVNNAGIAYKGSTFGHEEAAITLNCNLKGTRSVCEAMLPLLKASGEGRIVNLCSRAGMLRQLRSQQLREAFVSPPSADAIEALGDDFVAAIRDGTYQRDGWSSSMYGVSKLAEISYTRWLAADVKKDGVAVYACCPGYVVTDMTSGRGAKQPREGADTPVWLALQPIGTINQGGFFGEREQIDWAS